MHIFFLRLRSLRVHSIRRSSPIGAGAVPRPKISKTTYYRSCLSRWLAARPVRVGYWGGEFLCVLIAFCAHMHMHYIDIYGKPAFVHQLELHPGVMADRPQLQRQRGQRNQFVRRRFEVAVATSASAPSLSLSVLVKSPPKPPLSLSSMPHSSSSSSARE